MSGSHYQHRGLSLFSLAAYEWPSPMNIHSYQEANPIHDSYIILHPIGIQIVDLVLAGLVSLKAQLFILQRQIRIQI